MAKPTEIAKLKKRVEALEFIVHHLMHQTNVQDLSGTLVEINDDDEEIPTEFKRKKIGFKYGKTKEKKSKKK